MGTQAAPASKAPAVAPASADAAGSPGTVADSAWIVGRVGATNPRLRLLCLPQAGGSAASFAPWRLAVPPGLELATVELPGRGTRGAEPLPDTLEELAEAVTDGLTAEFDQPYALFGHSFGALLAHAVTRCIARRGLPLPRALLVSAARAPHRVVPERISERDDDGLRAWLDGFGGLPPELAAYPASLRYALRTVRRDLALAEAYRSVEPLPAGVPLHVLGGADDPLIRPAHLEHWRECAPAGCTVELLPGGHDFPFTGAPVVLGALAARLR